MLALHPFCNDAGKPVVIHEPSSPSALSCWNDAGQLATVVPGGPMPPSLNGIALAPWPGAADPCGWTALAGTSDHAEPPFRLPPGMAAAAGAVIVEDDGRVWVVAPSNQFGGYAATFPKGRVDPGTSLRCAAVREAFEESGLQVAIGAFLVDVQRSQTFTRYYLARRIGGHPAYMGWETQAVHLVPIAQLAQVASHKNDAAVIAALQGWIAPST
ncbi:MAG: NUDIX hydrolase [Telluria sp.]